MLGGKKYLYIIIGGLAVGIAAVLIVYFVMIAAGVIQTTTDRLVITTADAEKIYDGEALTCEEFTVSEGDLPKDYTVKTIFSGTRTDAGSSENFATAVIYDSQGADVTSKYEIEYKYGTLTVLPSELQFFTRNAAKEYDGTPLTTDHVEMSAGELLEGHTCDITVIGSRTEVGETETACEWKVTDAEGADVSQNYNVVYTPGRLTVRPIRLSYYSNDVEKLYDGTPLLASHYEMLGGTVLPGHRIEAVLKGERTDVGISESILFIKVYDASGEDVTSCYEIDYEPGNIKVLGRPVVVQTATDEKIYDGEPLTNGGWEHVGGELLSGHMLEVTVTGQRTMVGAANNIASARVKDGTGLDVTRNYSIEFEYGVLNVKGIPINVYSYSAEKEYDGTPLTEPRTPEYTGDLIRGHRFKAEAFGSQTEVGKSYNFIYARVLGEDDMDVSGFYEFIYNYGILTVYEPESEQNSDEHMIINSSEGGDIYLRTSSYGNYMNGTWYGQKNRFTSNTEFNPMYFASTAFDKDSSLLRSTLSITLWRSTARYVLPYYATTYSASPEDDVAPVGEFVKDEPYTVEMLFYEYSPETIGNYAISPEYAALEAQYASFVRKNYLDIMPDLKAEFSRIINENGIDPSSPTLIQDVIDYVSEAAEYSLEAVVPSGKDPLLYFLEEGKEGKCTEFAGAATLIYRTLGIPARITTGFLVADADAGKDITVKSQNAHAWVEIYLNGIGWVLVDPTPGDGGARGVNSIVVRPADESKYWTDEMEELRHSGAIYNEGGVINAIREKLQLGAEDKVKIEKAVYADPLNAPGASEAFVTGFRVYVNDELVYEYSKGEVVTNTTELKFIFNTGILKCYKYKITVTTTGTQSKVYDGTALDVDTSQFDYTWRVESEFDPDISTSDFDINCNIVLPEEMVDVGRVYIAVSDMIINTAIPAEEYHVFYEYAYAEVTRKDATLRVDGEGNYVVDGLISGHTLSTCDIDFEYNLFNIVISDAGGNDVTNNYALVLDIY